MQGTLLVVQCQSMSAAEFLLQYIVNFGIQHGSQNYEVIDSRKSRTSLPLSDCLRCDAKSIRHIFNLDARRLAECFDVGTSLLDVYSRNRHLFAAFLYAGNKKAACRILDKQL